MPMADRETLVFAYDTPEQRKQLFDLVRPLMSAESGLRIVALSYGNEVARAMKMQDAVERYRDYYDLADAIEDLAATEAPEDWTFEQYEAAQQ